MYDIRAATLKPRVMLIFSCILPLCFDYLLPIIYLFTIHKNAIPKLCVTKCIMSLLLITKKIAYFNLLTPLSCCLSIMSYCFFP